MPLYDFWCKTCEFEVRDYFSTTYDPGVFCGRCSTKMQKYLGVPRFNLKHSDLPGSGWEIFQPTFNKHLRSKRETMEELHVLNTRLAEEADKENRPFKPYVWTPEDKGMEELSELRKEVGAKGVDEYVNRQVMEQQDRAFTKDLEEGLNIVSDKLEAEM